MHSMNKLGVRMSDHSTNTEGYSSCGLGCYCHTTTDVDARGEAHDYASFRTVDEKGTVKHKEVQACCNPWWYVG